MRAVLALLLSLLLAPLALAQPVHGIANIGDPALPPDFKAFSYVKPDVKKGGRISHGVVGTFNNLNPFILKAKRTTARGMWDPEFGYLVHEPLMLRSRDEPFAMYGLLAQTVEWDDARSFIQFNLNPAARWSDGKPVTADDVIFTFELLRDKGRPPFSTRLDKVAKMEKVGDNSVRFTFNEHADREFPLILALSPILPKHATKVEGFDETTLTPPIGSGPYRVKDVKPGERIVFERNPDYWAKDLPSKVGFDNFDEVSIEYFAQETTLFEAFKKGEVHLYADGAPMSWDHAYNFPAVERGDVIKKEFKPNLPANLYGFVFNLRRPIFSDVRVREALANAFDFEWVNKNLYENAYTRTQSFWQNSELSSMDVKADEREKAILGDAAATMPKAVLDGTYRMPVTDASGLDRKVLRTVFEQLKSAGYVLKDRVMTGPDGNPLAFEILTQNSDQEKMSLAFQRTLAALGIKVTIRTVEDAQYQERTSRYDYDMILKTYASSLSPGIEQAQRWGSEYRDAAGGDNLAGVADPAIDRAVKAIVTAPTMDDFKAAVRAHDRLLIAGHYVIPLFHLGSQRYAYWKQLGHPDVLPAYGVQLPAWFDATLQ